MRKSLVSTAAALLLSFGAAGAQAQVALANADFELSMVANNSVDTFANLGYSNVQWGWLGGASRIVDVGGQQMAQVVGGDAIWTSFAASSAGHYRLTFDAVGDGYFTLFNLDTYTTVAQTFVQNTAMAQSTTAYFALTSTNNYRLYFGTTPLPPNFTASLTIDNVAITQVAAPVPEPERYAMMLGGLGAIGLMGRRRLRPRA